MKRRKNNELAYLLVLAIVVMFVVIPVTTTGSSILDDIGDTLGDLWDDLVNTGEDVVDTGQDYIDGEDEVKDYTLIINIRDDLHLQADSDCHNALDLYVRCEEGTCAAGEECLLFEQQGVGRYCACAEKLPEGSEIEDLPRIHCFHVSGGHPTCDGDCPFGMTCKPYEDKNNQYMIIERGCECVSCATTNLGCADSDGNFQLPANPSPNNGLDQFDIFGKVTLRQKDCDNKLKDIVYEDMCWVIKKESPSADKRGIDEYSCGLNNALIKNNEECSGCSDGACYKVKCDDGTYWGDCSANKPYFCATITEYTTDCEYCGCPAGDNCETTHGTCGDDCSAELYHEELGVGSTNGLGHGECAPSVKPKYCYDGKFIDNCQDCGCPNPTTETCTADGACKTQCIVGGVKYDHGKCLSNKICDDGTWSWNPPVCGCPNGMYEQADGSCGDEVSCMDGTLHDVCSETTIGKKCINGILYNRCGDCKCPISTPVCKSDGTCTDNCGSIADGTCSGFYRCYNGKLVPECSTCGCAPEYTYCYSNGVCGW